MSEAVPAGEIQIEAITGDNGRLSCVPEDNCAGIAGKATLELLGAQSVGIVLNLHKGLPLGSGLGSSAASAAAAAAAVSLCCFLEQFVEVFPAGYVVINCC